MSNDYHRFFEQARIVAQARDTQDARLELSHKCSFALGRYDGPCYTYADDLIEIVAAHDGKALSVELPSNRNPVVCINEKGKVIRTHGEMWNVRSHLEQLASPLGLLGSTAD